MTGLVFALGVLLALAGAFSVVSGAPIIQVERGWAEVIAGSVAVSGGVVTLAIGVVLLRLSTLVEVARRTAQPVMVATPEPVAAMLPEPALPPMPPEPAPALENEESPLRPTRAPDEPVFVASEAAAVAPSAVDEAAVAEPAPLEPRGRFWHRRRDRAETLAEDEPPAPVTPPTVDEAPSPIAASPHPEEPVPADENGYHPPPSIALEIEADLPGPRRLSAASSDLPIPEREPPVRPSSFFQDWRSKPLLRSRRAAVPLPEVPPPLFESPPGEIEAPRLGSGTAEGDQAPLPAIEGPPADDDQPAAAAVIGRYQAGASSYTMYADGVIDVETESGDRHRFASMDELKAFIARQEQVVG